jgi:putative transposase
MARPLRIQAPGLTYHVMARGNNKMKLFWNAGDYLQFLEILGTMLEKYEVNCWTYTLMPNHYHLVLRTRKANVSSAGRQLNGVFAQWWNKRHKHVGHVFEGRFKAQIVEDNVYLLRLCRYVLLNPVRAGLCAAPDGWRWSSYRALVTGVKDPAWIDIESLLSRLEDGCAVDARQRLIAFIGDASDDEMGDFVRGDRRVIGSETFAARFEHVARAASKEVPAVERRTGSPSLAAILRSSIAASEGLDRGIARAHRDYAYSIEDIVRCTRLSPGAVRRLIRQQVSEAGVTALD